MTGPTDKIGNISDANRSQVGVGLQVEQYCNAVLEQPNVDFTGFNNPALTKSEGEINTGLATAKAHAQTYLRQIQPSIISNVVNIGNYFALHNAVAATLPPGSTEQQWLSVLGSMREQAEGYRTHAADIATMLGTFHDGLTTDVASFSKTVATLNSVVDGDNGALAQLDKDLADMQGKIDGCIAGIVLSGLAIAGGVFLVIVGAVADFVTAGTSTPVIVLGGAIIAAGIGGEVASALTLAGLQKASAGIMTQKSTLNSEVKLATAIGTGYGSLRDNAKNAVEAAGKMKSAWEYLKDDLGALSDDLQNGIKSTDVVRTLFLNAAGTAVKTVITDTNIIKGQMTGTQLLIAPAGQSVSDYVVQVAQKQAA